MISTKEAKEHYNFKIKKSLGQNFINDSNILNKIVEQAGVDKNTNIIEVGPGLGALTERLVEKAGYVVSIEYDKTLEEILKKNIKAKNFKLVIEDFLKSDLEKIISIFPKENSSNTIKVVANLPYYITSAIIMKILTSKANIESITIMLQKEVAERIVAQPKSKEYGLLTIFSKYYAEVEYLFNVNRTCFVPIPNVDSAVIKLTKKKSNDNIEEEELSKLLHAAFSSRRKQLINNLANEQICSKQNAIQILTKLKLNPLIRPEEILLEQYIQINKEINKIKEVENEKY